MEYRNEILKMARNAGFEVFAKLMMSNNFQAGLDALDPDCPCYVQDRAIQTCIYLGLQRMIEIAEITTAVTPR